MRLVKFAMRMVAEHRKDLTSVGAALILVSGLATVAGSVVGSLRQNTAEFFRIAPEGEYSGVVDARGAHRIRELWGETLDVSVVHQELGTLDVGNQLVLVTLTRADLPRELAYRGIVAADLETSDTIDDISERDAVIVTDDPQFAALAGRVARVSDEAGASSFVRIRSTAGAGREEIEVIVHQPDRLLDGPVLVRIRGSERPITRRTFDALAATRWREHASMRTRGLTTRLAILFPALMGIAVAVLIPGQLLLIRRASTDYRLLHSWGVLPAQIRGVAVLVGAYAAMVAGAAGAVLGLVVVTVSNAQGTAAVDLLPYEWMLEFGLRVPGPATPSVGWAVASVAVSTLLGAVAALPSLPFLATIGSRRGVWE